MPPYSFYLDDCYEDEFDEVDNSLFAELKQELELERESLKMHTSGEIDC